MGIVMVFPPGTVERLGNPQQMLVGFLVHSKCSVRWVVPLLSFLCLCSVGFFSILRTVLLVLCLVAMGAVSGKSFRKMWCVRCWFFLCLVIDQTSRCCCLGTERPLSPDQRLCCLPLGRWPMGCFHLQTVFHSRLFAFWTWQDACSG